LTELLGQATTLGDGIASSLIQGLTVDPDGGRNACAVIIERVTDQILEQLPHLNGVGIYYREVFNLDTPDLETRIEQASADLTDFSSVVPQTNSRRHN
jgi:hypothetical protein